MAVVRPYTVSSSELLTVYVPLRVIAAVFAKSGTVPDSS
jgi:hypothetical protein